MTLYRSYQSFINDPQSAYYDILAELELIDIAKQLTSQTPDVEAFWHILSRKKNIRNLVKEEQLPPFFLSLILHLKQALDGTSRWDSKTSCQRKELTTALINKVKKLIKHFDEYLAESSNPLATSLDLLIPKYAESPELYRELKEVNYELRQASVRRLYVTPSDIGSLHDIQGWLEASLKVMEEGSDCTRETTLVPTKGDSKRVTTFVRIMGRWTESKLGSKNYPLLTQLCYIYLENEIHSNFDTDNVKSIFKRNR